MTIEWWRMLSEIVSFSLNFTMGVPCCIRTVVNNINQSADTFGVILDRVNHNNSKRVNLLLIRSFAINIYLSKDLYIFGVIPVNTLKIFVK